MSRRTKNKQLLGFRFKQLYNLNTIKFTCLNHLMDFSIFTKLCDHHHNLILELFISPQRNPILSTHRLSLPQDMEGLIWQTLTSALVNGVAL